MVHMQVNVTVGELQLHFLICQLREPEIRTGPNSNGGNIAVELGAPIHVCIDRIPIRERPVGFSVDPIIRRRGAHGNTAGQIVEPSYPRGRIILLCEERHRETTERTGNEKCS